MGKQFGNQDVDAPSDNVDHKQTNPSTQKNPPTKPRSAFKGDRVTHFHIDPVGQEYSKMDYESEDNASRILGGMGKSG